MACRLTRRQLRAAPRRGAAAERLPVVRPLRAAAAVVKGIRIKDSDSKKEALRRLKARLPHPHLLRASCVAPRCDAL
jgi:hypothetical protein